ncbi:uroporphyrinogen decarboxylase family protein [uncultured Cloacibacillus sp.]|uniref:uroporphyrinogen decarboxylase family protein n=1 Tax=uncultured Cloacibacillus sp. TaxID=889794 RepID=UPI0026DC9F82|nr:uroporphyrinogen decarboxylase family protein [uncultured Cloacibacillus sp.]
MKELSIQERMEYLYQGKTIDRVPLITNATLFSGIFARLNSQDFLCNAHNMYYAQEQTRGLFECHGAPSFCHTNWLAECFGASNKYQETPWGFSVPQIKPVICSESDAESLSCPPLEGQFVLELRQNFIDTARANGRKMVGVTAGSVVEIAAQITKTNLFMNWLKKNPKLIYHICNVITEFLLKLIDRDIAKYGAENCTALFFYPLESHEIMSPDLLNKFSWPYIFDMHKILQEKGIRNFSEHLCGSQNNNLPVYKELKIPARACFSLDERTDLKLASRILGCEHIIMGNVNTCILATGTAQQVFEKCREILNIGKGCEGGFILSPSCDLPPNTPPLNLYAMQRAVRQYGKY